MEGGSDLFLGIDPFSFHQSFSCFFFLGFTGLEASVVFGHQKKLWTRVKVAFIQTK